MPITAKVYVVRSTETGQGEDREVHVTLAADYADGRNKEWARYTPVLNLKISLKDAVADKFKVGQRYLLTFEEETDAPDPVQTETSDTSAQGGEPEAPAN